MPFKFPLRRSLMAITQERRFEFIICSWKAKQTLDLRKRFLVSVFRKDVDFAVLYQISVLKVSVWCLSRIRRKYPLPWENRLHLQSKTKPQKHALDCPLRDNATSLKSNVTWIKLMRAYTLSFHFKGDRKEEPTLKISKEKESQTAGVWSTHAVF